MAKRANPFVEDFIPQSKVHVGLKQFNNNDDRLKKVYEKTLKLLFKGAKKIPSVDGMNNNNIQYIRKDEKMKQLFIGKDGSLLHSGSMVNPDISTKQCSCGDTVEAQCVYCEAALCGACQHCCERCKGVYCTCCILIGSEGSEVCVSCYG